MRVDIKTVALGVGLVVLVALGAYSLFDGSRRPSPSLPTAPPKPAAAPVVEQHPEIRAALDHVRQGALDEAVKLLEQVPKTAPHYTVALNNLGYLYAEREEDERAMKAFVKLAMLQPENPTAYVGLASAHYSAGRYEKAELNALRALELDPGLIPARYRLGLFRIAQGRSAEGVRTYSRALKRDRHRSYLPRAEHDLRRLETDLPARHYALAYFANVLKRPREEVSELEQFLARVETGQLADVARARLAEAQLVVKLQAEREAAAAQ